MLKNLSSKDFKTFDSTNFLLAFSSSNKVNYYSSILLISFVFFSSKSSLSYLSFSTYSYNFINYSLIILNLVSSAGLSLFILSSILLSLSSAASFLSTFSLSKFVETWVHLSVRIFILNFEGLSALSTLKLTDFYGD